MTAFKGLSGQYSSFGIGTWGDIAVPVEETTFKMEVDSGNQLVKTPFYINNLGEDIVETEGKGINMTDDQTVKLLPGWNEYILTEIVVPIGATLQWGL